jgi:peptidoglycan-associated lipoprotein
MSKKILLITSVIFLSSCAATNIQELGDKFLDLINPSDAPAEVADLSEQVLVLSDESGGFTEEELETLSNDELIALAKEKGLEDKLVLDADGNLQNRDEIIKALVESEALSESLKEGATEELESLSNDALIEIAQAKGIEDKIILDEDGNLQNRDELIEALVEGAAETELAVAELEKIGGSFVLYFAYDDTEIDEAATRVIIEHANFMQNNPSVRLRLEGHADERGTREYNLALGENRALSVKEVLGLYNLEDRVVVVSYGEEQPIEIEHNEEAWEKNRRVEFVYY